MRCLRYVVRWWYVPTVLCSLLIAAALSSQSSGDDQNPPPPQPGQPGPRPPGFGFPGFGPPGFGPPGRMGDPAAGVNLLGMPEVQKELKLDEAQQKQIGEITAGMRDQMRTGFEGINFGELQSLEPEEREKRFDEMRAKTEAVVKKSQARVDELLNETQRARLAELRLQREGLRSLLRPEIAKKLKLEDEQTKKLQDILSGGPPPFAPPQERQKQDADALAVLGERQQAEWKSMQGEPFKFPAFGFGPGGPGGPPGGQEQLLVAKFDKDGDGKLNRAERDAARESLKKERGNRPGFGFGPPGGPRAPGGPGPGPGGPEGRRRPDGERPGGPPRGPGGFGPPGDREPAKPGRKISPADVTAEMGELYDARVFRTFFLDFDEDDWEADMADFNRTDVEVPATLTVDGKKYPGVGVQFRGMSSFFGVQAGSKRSLNISVDFTDEDQRLGGYKTLNLLNAHEDPSLLHTVLYFEIARNYIPAPKANFVRVVINGENWGVYTNVQQFNKEFIAENFQSDKGARWKVPGSPGGRGGLQYLGEDLEAYKRIYRIKSKDGDKSWKALRKLCQTLTETPLDKLESELEPMLDIDGALWFLALENVLINSDGYWIRASDYSIYLDPDGKFHILPHDANETFQPGMGPGMGFGGGGGRGGNPLELDPLTGMNDSSKPLRSRLLAVPALREKYLAHVRTLAEDQLDWKRLGPIVASHVKLIDAAVQDDTKKLSSYEAFRATVSDGQPESAGERRPRMTLRSFADQRRKYLLEATK
ncbi:MAG TPA: CotH kinase family protein [Planctomycetaceae bacterium]|nr:CotH kinase family protein [Planctomycetaceae bacterium]